MSEETVQHVVSLLQTGATPLFKLRVRRGRDSRLIRVMDTDSVKFYCVFADSLTEELFTLSHDSIKHGTFMLEEIESVNS